MPKCINLTLFETKVEDWKDGREREDREPYEVERIATILAVTCMFLAALYTIFAILLFLYFGSEDDESVAEHHHHDVKPLRSIASDSRREKFITMDQT